MVDVLTVHYSMYVSLTEKWWMLDDLAAKIISDHSIGLHNFTNIVCHISFFLYCRIDLPPTHKPSSCEERTFSVPQKEAMLQVSGYKHLKLR